MYGSKYHRDPSSPVCTLKLLCLLHTAPIVSSSPMKAPVYQSSTPSAVGSSKKGKHTNLIRILGIGAGIVIIAIVSILIICSCTFRKGKPKASSKETEPVNPGTKDPAPAAGPLPHPSTVAIKRLTNGGQQGDKEFLVEVEMLSRLHHRNLVKLVGYYSSRDSSQNLLCYELVPNGSLEAWLHGNLIHILPAF
ncbi:hypothetical protein OIU84_016382 [Salix udensis]|uniref:Protein kinase domain-containing protein n=1 Tax=Salix udensis TaxID=889485 RepID=A0AAD6J9A6_9ROSI|nr:hypothetical protein OIU84_016382 [Salix udensis]